MSINNNANLSSISPNSPNPTSPSVGQNAAGRKIVQGLQAQSGILQKGSGSGLAAKIKVQNQRKAQQGTQNTISELNKSSQTEHTSKHEQVSTQYNKKSSLEK
jgi:hypothetical protein